MGVKSLWSLLEPARRTIPLEDLENKTICVDLSYWIVQFAASCQNGPPQAGVQSNQKPHLRGIFHRLRALKALNSHVIFVTDGDVPAVKRATYQQRRADDAATSHPHWRRAGRGNATAAGSAGAIATGSAAATGADSGAQPTSKPPRAPEGALKRRRGTEFARMVADAKALGAAWGVPCIDSPEEAEAQCALLNAFGVCDVVCTGDSDAFLFGAKAVVRDICLHKGANWAVLYTAADIAASLSLGRNSLIAMGLFLGSDYSQGVSSAPTLRARQGAVQRVAALGEDGVLAAIRERGLAAIAAPKARRRAGPGTGAQGKKGQQRRKGVGGGEGRGRGDVTESRESGMSGCVGVGTGGGSGAEGNPSAGEGGHEQGAREMEDGGEEQAREDAARVIEAFLNPPCHDAASDAVKSALQKHCSPSCVDIVAFCDRHMAWPADVTARYIGSKLAERDLRRLLLVRQAAEICVTPGKEASRKADEVGGMLDGVRYRVGGIVKERWVAGHRMFEVSWTGQPEVENSVVRAELLTRVHPEMVQAYESEKEAGRNKGRGKQQRKATETRGTKEKETTEMSEFMTDLGEAPGNDVCGGYTEWEDETEYQRSQGVAGQPLHTDNSVTERSHTLLFSVTTDSSSGERSGADAGTSADLKGDREPSSRSEPSPYDQLYLPSEFRQTESDQAALSSAQNHEIQARGAVHQMKKIVQSASHEEDVVEAGRQEVGVLKRCQKPDAKPVESRSRGAVKSNENGLLWVWQQEDYPPKEQQKGKRSRVQDRSAVQNAQQRRGGPFIDLTNMTTLRNDKQDSTTAAESVGISNGGKAVSDCIDLIHLGNGDSPGRMRGRGQAGRGKLVRRENVHGTDRWVTAGKHEVVDLDTPESVTVKVALRGNAMLQEAGGCLLASKLDFAGAIWGGESSCALVNLID